jgi:hypothetical protein
MTTEQLRLPLLPAGAEPLREYETNRPELEWASNRARQIPDSSPAEIFGRVFRRVELKRPLPHFRVEFRAYAGLRSTIQARDGHLHVWISDLLTDAPTIVLEALAEILLSKLFRKRPSREARECYLAHVYKESTRSRIEEVRRTRGYKRQRPARGRCFDLEEIFSALNRRFFGEQLTKPLIGWSAKRSRTILGHYDSAHGSITISRWLDSLAIPRYLVEYIMFHEMLHMKHPVERNGHRRLVHSREFQRAEKRFPEYERARRRLKRLCGQPLEGRE